MFELIAKTILHALALVIVSNLVPGIEVADFRAAIIAVVVISIVNAVIRPVLFILTLPVTVISLGLFVFVLNAAMFLIASRITPGLTVDGFGSAILGSILYSLVSTILLALVR